MHGAWVFDLLLMFFTGGITVVAFRQLTGEQDQTDGVVLDLPRTRLESVTSDASVMGAGSHRPVA